MHDYRVLRISISPFNSMERLIALEFIENVAGFLLFFKHIYFIKTQQKDRSALIYYVPPQRLLCSERTFVHSQVRELKHKHNLIKLQFGFHNKLILTASRNSQSQNAVAGAHPPPTRRSIMLLENKSFSYAYLSDGGGIEMFYSEKLHGV